MKLVDHVVRSFKVAKIFRENSDRINSIDFSPNGDTLISCSEDDQIVIYDCEKGTQVRTVNSKKYGVDLIHFTHAKNTAIHSSTKIDDTIRYLSLHDNKYIRYFPGHTKKVVSLCISPIEDTFLSGSLDKSLRLWDLRSPNCHGVMNVSGRPVAAYDPEGLIFAAGVNSESIKLYDLRSFDKGPFVTFKLSQEKECDWTGLKFSRDGKTILISTNGSTIRLIDAFHGTPLQTFAGYLNNKGIAIEASFSPDSQFVFSGSTDGRVHVWNAETGYKVCVLNGDHPAPVQCIQFNPKYMMLASACTNMAFWLPTVDENVIVPDGKASSSYKRTYQINLQDVQTLESVILGCARERNKRIQEEEKKEEKATENKELGITTDSVHGVLRQFWRSAMLFRKIVNSMSYTERFACVVYTASSCVPACSV
ncbi:hypothetical protein HN011_000202 [Eciton burchellii]|nr:hypothetical protein HN011_000202 [Eciton burchellii]